jgi:hypothetical protein
MSQPRITEENFMTVMGEEQSTAIISKVLLQKPAPLAEVKNASAARPPPRSVQDAQSMVSFSFTGSNFLTKTGQTLNATMIGIWKSSNSDGTLETH